MDPLTALFEALFQFSMAYVILQHVPVSSPDKRGKLKLATDNWLKKFPKHILSSNLRALASHLHKE